MTAVAGARCSRSDLPPSDCYHCRGLEDVKVPELGLPGVVRPIAPHRDSVEPLIARSPLECDVCGQVIRRGEWFLRSTASAGERLNWCGVCR